MTDELVLHVRGTAADFDRLFRIVEASGLRLAEDGPGRAHITNLRPPLWKPGTVTQFVRKQVTE